MPDAPADRVVAMSRRADRQAFARTFGPTDVIGPGRVFDLVLPLSEVAEAYAARDERRAVKAMLVP